MTPGDLVFIGDVHLDRDDDHLDPFLRLLDRLASTASRIVLLGDLFNLWIGERDLEQPHQAAVVEKFAELRSRGIAIRYVEGNRDYHVADGYVDAFLDEASDRGIVERVEGRSIFAIHGDLANVHDRRYRRWRRLSRSRPFWWLFRTVPRRRRLALAEGLERRMRRSNLEYKGALPESEIRRYAAGFFSRGHDVVVLGHFHVEREIDAEPPSPPGRIFVLPEWKGSRRHLRVSPTGEIEFVGPRV